MDLLISKGHPIMLVGSSGCGKTSVIRSTLDALDQESTYLIVNVPFNFYTSSATVQRHGAAPREEVGKNFGPPGRRRSSTSSMISTYLRWICTGHVNLIPSFGSIWTTATGTIATS
ncbi:dynein beta chain, ciliary [Caerostris extrusa]|uniref:Dynein beta chain, ciliary n=1 Tax=Caerostris extrusa TaxID=172846 RepID=A0AAV4V8E0_CAEEX|nr:dynein beta chain, ciliary [Caerostris extrusa]